MNDKDHNASLAAGVTAEPVASDAATARHTHTLGPWRRSAIDAYVIGATPVLRVDVPQMQAVCRVMERLNETEANAHLIAAAPEMYEALKVALVGAKHESCMFTDDDPDPSHHCCDWNEVVRVIQAALAKAEGK